MLHILLPFFFLAHPGVDQLGPDRYGRLEKLRGTTIELFAQPGGPDEKAVAEKVWKLAFAAGGAPGTFEVTLTQGWRGQNGVPSVVPPPPRTFKLEVSEGPCGSATLKGSAVDHPDVTLDVTSHTTRLCEDNPANDLLATLVEGKVTTKLYDKPGF